MPKAIIEGKRYNTETATKVANHSFSYSSDFRWVHEDLYCTPKGAWFICGSGGPMSKYARSIGQNSWSGTRNAIVPITAKEAKKFLEDEGETDAIEEYFSESITDA
jgi:hypothetical protein